MEKITEIDDILREDIAKSDQDMGIYFITRKAQNKQYGSGCIKPCSPSKICVSDILLLKPKQRILPVGFEPINKSLFSTINSEIEHEISNFEIIKDGIYMISLKEKEAEEIIHNAYKTIKKDKDLLKNQIL